MEIADDRAFIVSDVFCGSLLEVFGVSFHIDLIPIAKRELRVTVGMDWMETSDANIPCHYIQDRVRTPAGMDYDRMMFLG